MSYEECEKHGVDVTNQRCIECLAEGPHTEIELPWASAIFACSRAPKGCLACGGSTFDARGGVAMVLLNASADSIEAKATKATLVRFCRDCLQRLLDLATHNDGELTGSDRLFARIVEGVRKQR
jgi:hypothetical protein